MSKSNKKTKPSAKKRTAKRELARKEEHAKKHPSDMPDAPRSKSTQS